MPVLPNHKHELFAQGLAEGKTADKAYADAGFNPNRGNAATLKAKQSIVGRVDELLSIAAAKTVVTIQDIAEQLDEDRTFARELENPSAAISATMGKAKVLGLLTEKHEHTGKDGGAIEIERKSPRDVAKAIAFLLASAAKQAE